MKYPPPVQALLKNLKHLSAAGQAAAAAPKPRVWGQSTLQFSHWHDSDGAPQVSFSVIGNPVLIALAEYWAREISAGRPAPTSDQCLAALELQRDALGLVLLIEDAWRDVAPGVDGDALQ